MDMPAEVAPLLVTFPEGLELLGATIDTAVTQPGDWVWATLYWRKPGELPGSPPLVHLELFGRNFDRIGRLIAYHGRGNYPATLWPMDGIVADQVAVQVIDWAETPVVARVAVKLAEDADSVDIGMVKIVPPTWPDMTEEPLARLGEGIEIAGLSLPSDTAAPGDDVSVDVVWQVTAPPGPALLHAFVHVGDPTQAPLAQHDGPVMGNEYPASVWVAGEVFGETLTLTLPGDLPPGNYPIQLGLYDFASGVRLPVTIDGQRRPTDTVPIGTLTVTND